jgi:hypothetical protein
MFFFSIWFLGITLWWVLPGAAEEPEQEFLDSSKGVFFFGHQAGEQNDKPLMLEQDYPVYAHTALEKAFADFGIENRKTVDVSTGLALESIDALCRAEGARWGIIAMTSFEGDLFSWHFSIYDGEQQFFRGYDFFSIHTLVGVSATQIIDHSAQKLAKNWYDAFSSRAFDGRLAVTQGQRFSSPQDGVRILFGSPDYFLDGGVVVDGVMTSPLYLFTAGTPLYGYAVKDRYWPRSFTLPKGITSTTLELPKLQRKVRHSFGMSYVFRGDLFASINLEYRFHVLPDRLFLKATWGIWNDTAELSGGEVALYQEYGFGGGVYLQPANDAAFRLYAGTGIALVTASGALITLADPLWLGMEYHFPHWALKGECRFPGILGYQRDVYEPDQTDGNYYGSIGIVLKW